MGYYKANVHGAFHYQPEMQRELQYTSKIVEMEPELRNASSFGVIISFSGWKLLLQRYKAYSALIICLAYSTSIESHSILQKRWSHSLAKFIMTRQTLAPSCVYSSNWTNLSHIILHTFLLFCYITMYTKDGISTLKVILHFHSESYLSIICWILEPALCYPIIEF